MQGFVCLADTFEPLVCTFPCQKGQSKWFSLFSPFDYYSIRIFPLSSQSYICTYIADSELGAQNAEYKMQNTEYRTRANILG